MIFLNIWVIEIIKCIVWYFLLCSSWTVSQRNWYKFRCEASILINGIDKRAHARARNRHLCLFLIIEMINRNGETLNPTEWDQLYLLNEGTLTHLFYTTLQLEVSGYSRAGKTRALRPRLRKIEQHEVYISPPGIWIRTLNEHESWRQSASASRNNQKRWLELSPDVSLRRHLTAPRGLVRVSLLENVI